jgi:MFS transporter, DHA2 family, multidrug resistance protein
MAEIVWQSETPRSSTSKVDRLGFGTLSPAIGAVQVLLDRGEQLDWFGSREILIEVVAAGSAFYLFLMRTVAANELLESPFRFRDANCTASTPFVAILGLTYHASVALQPSSTKFHELPGC